MSVKYSDSAQVKTAIGEHLEKHRILARRTCYFDPKIGLVLREIQNFRTILEHRRNARRVESPPVRFSDVGHELGFNAAGFLQECGQTSKQLVIRDL
jgi:hypothetical protein